MSNIIHDQSAPERLLESMKQYEESSGRLSVFDLVSNYFEPLAEILGNGDSRIDPASLPHFKRILIVLERYLFVYLVCRRKIDAIISMSEWSIREKNSIAFAQGVRALMEHFAVSAEIQRSINNFYKRISGKSDLNLIIAAVNEAESFLRRCYFGQSGKGNSKGKPEDQVTALHINDCLKTLSQFHEGCINEYDFLCEFVHPNAGSNKLVSTENLGLRIESIKSDFTSPDIMQMIEIASKLLETSKELEIQIYSGIQAFTIYLRRSRFPKSKITNIFALKKIGPMGDGKSIDTAIFFPGARDGLEAINLMKRYLENRRVEVRSRRLVRREWPVMFDLYETSIGEIWHRIDHDDSDSPSLHLGSRLSAIGLFGLSLSEFNSGIANSRPDGGSVREA
jgi:hypothetical protein